MPIVKFHSAEYETYCYYEFNEESGCDDFTETITFPRYGLFDVNDLCSVDICIDSIEEPKLEEFYDKIIKNWNYWCNTVGDLEFAFSSLKNLFKVCNNECEVDYGTLFTIYDDILETANAIVNKKYKLFKDVHEVEDLVKHKDEYYHGNFSYTSVKGLGRYIHNTLQGWFLPQGYFLLEGQC